MPQTNHGSIEFLKFPNPLYPGDDTRMIKKWLRDSWARRKILALQQAIGGITVPTASTANPQMDGTAAPGSSTDYSRADHVHPSDTAKQDALTSAQMDAVNSGVTAAKIATYDAQNNGVLFYNFTYAKVITITLSQSSVGIIHLATRTGTTPKVDDIAISGTSIGHSNTSSLFTPAMANSGKTITLTATGSYHGYLVMGGLFMQYITNITVTS